MATGCPAARGPLCCCLACLHCPSDRLLSWPARDARSSCIASSGSRNCFFYPFFSFLSPWCSPGALKVGCDVTTRISSNDSTRFLFLRLPSFHQCLRGSTSTSTLQKTTSTSIVASLSPCMQLRNFRGSLSSVKCERRRGPAFHLPFGAFAASAAARSSESSWILLRVDASVQFRFAARIETSSHDIHVSVASLRTWMREARLLPRRTNDRQRQTSSSHASERWIRQPKTRGRAAAATAKIETPAAALAWNNETAARQT